MKVLAQNPIEKANFISLLTFWWTFPLYRKGWSQDIKVEDLYKIRKSDKSTVLGDKLSKQWTKQSKTSHPSMLKAVLYTFRKELIVIEILILLSIFAVDVPLPFIIERFIAYFELNTKMSIHEAWYYAGALFVFLILKLIVSPHIHMQCNYSGMKVRIAICSMVYRKILRLSQSSILNADLGNIVNLLSNDLNRCEYFMEGIPSFFAGTMTFIIFLFIMWYQYQWAGVIGWITNVLIVASQGALSKLASKIRMKAAKFTDKRIKLLNKILHGIQIIKARAWEPQFIKKISLAKKLELHIIQYTLYIHGIIRNVRICDVAIVTCSVMISFVILYGSSELSSGKIFGLIAFLNMATSVMSYFYGRCFTDIAEFLVALKRVERIMILDEKDEQIENPQNHMKDNMISISSTNAFWEDPKTPLISKEEIALTEFFPSYNKGATLKNIDIEIKTGDLVVIVGPMGSGKTSILHLILKELFLDTGSIKIQGTQSYCSQQPWIFPGTIQENILFYNKVERSQMYTVLEACHILEDLENFPNGEHTQVGERGSLLSGGQKSRISLARAIYQKADIYLFDDPLSSVDIIVAKHIFNRCIGPNSILAKNGSTRILVTHQINFAKEADLVFVLNNGQIIAEGSSDILMTMDGIRNDLNLISKTTGEDNVYNSHSTDGDFTKKSRIELLEQSSKGKVKGFLLWVYLKSANDFKFIGISIMLLILTQILSSANDYWVGFWLSQEDLRNNYTVNLETKNESYPDLLWSTESCILVQLGILIALVTFGTLRFIFLFKLCQKASQKINDKMFKTVIETRLKFFNTNPSGRILNRFSKDMGIVDEEMPQLLLQVVQLFLRLIGTSIVTLILCPIALVPVCVLFIALTYITIFYLRTSMNVKRLEGMTRSPVYTHISTTLEGLTNIRAFHRQSQMLKTFNKHQDLHSAAWFSFISIDCSLGLFLGIPTLLLAVVVVTFSLAFDKDILGTDIGLIITQVMLLDQTVHFVCRDCGSLINQLISVERALDYYNLKPEQNVNKNKNVHKNWPTQGKIVFSNVNYRYSKKSKLALENLNFMINPGEKCGIVGRTGAGKTSLVGTFYRFAEVQGKILIDDIDTSDINLSQLRPAISIVPQDPILFSESLRENLDPFNQHSDSDIWNVLEIVNLKHLAQGPLKLMESIKSKGQFSSGQKQLMYFAQALLRKNNILILDEITSNVDFKMIDRIKQIINKHFTDCTVLMIAHRIQSVMDFDRVLVLDNGNLIENDAPYKLLQNPNGVFSKMVQALGDAEAKHLFKTAKDSYKAKNKK